MVVKLGWPEIIDLLLNVEKRIVLIMPAIHEEWIDVMDSIDGTQHEVAIKICIQNSESAIRNGYGSEKSIQRLRENYVDLQECDDLRINFLCVDERAYCLFLESRILSGDPSGYNAIELDKNTADNIIDQFFPAVVKPNSKVLSQPLDNVKFEKVQEELKKNPPSQPDLQRQINTYKTHFQYAEIHFEGGNMQTKTITIPKDALPFKDADLKNRMKTSFNLFTKEDTDKWTNLEEINKMVASIRSEFLHPCKFKKGRSILKKEKKILFLKKIEELEKLVTEKTKDLNESIQIAINKSEDTLTNELTTFFKANPPEKIMEIKDDELRKRQLIKMIQNIIMKTKIPLASDLVGKMIIDTQYAEFTEEDLSNVEFLQWFKEKGLISSETENELASFDLAYKIKI